jgi:hypothetical protein
MRISMERPYSDFSQREFPEGGRGSSSRSPFTLTHLQIAGIILIIVFIWGMVSAITFAMFDIHLLALTEFDDDGRADVAGYVTDDQGNTLYNVTIIVHGTQYFTRTNLDGYYTIENIKEGEYEIEASQDGYGTLTKRVTLDPNTPTLVNFVLEEGGFDTTENERYGSNLSDLEHLNYSTAAIIIVYSSFALIGGILSYFQRYFWLAMFGGLCGIIAGVFSIGIVIAPILSFIALIIIVRNQEEFVTAERPLLERLLKIERAKTRPTGVAKGGAVKHKSPSPPPVKTKASKPMVPMVPMSPPRDLEPSMTCSACGGTVKSESMGTYCPECGAMYHKFCGSSISVCKSCGSPL